MGMRPSILFLLSFLWLLISIFQTSPARLRQPSVSQKHSSACLRFPIPASCGNVSEFHPRKADPFGHFSHSLLTHCPFSAPRRTNLRIFSLRIPVSAFGITRPNNSSLSGRTYLPLRLRQHQKHESTDILHDNSNAVHVPLLCERGTRCWDESLRGEPWWRRRFLLHVRRCWESEH